MCGDEGKDKVGKEERGQRLRDHFAKVRIISKSVENYGIICSRKIAHSCVKIS